MQVNGKPVNFPFKSSGLSVQLVGTYISVKISFGLEVRYQSPYNVYINLDSSFHGRVTGNAFADVYGVVVISLLLFLLKLYLINKHNLHRPSGKLFYTNKTTAPSGSVESICSA